MPAIQVTMRVQGTRELGQALRQLSQKEAKKIVRTEQRKAAKLIQQSAKAKVPVQPNATPAGTLKKSIIVKQKTYRGGSIVVTMVGVNEDARADVSVAGRKARKQVPAFIDHLVENGHRIGIRGSKLKRVEKGGDNRLGGHTASNGRTFAEGKPYLIAASNEMQGQVLDMMGQGIVNQIAAAWASA